MSHNKNQKEVELAIYKDLDVLRADTVKNTIYFVYSSATQKVTQIWVTSDKNIPRKVELSANVTLKTVTSPNGTIEVVETSSEIQLELEASILALINSSLQAGDNISSLVNDAGYITISDIPPFVPLDYELEEFNNNGADPYAHQSEITSGITNLSYTASPTQGTVNSDTGADALIPLADLTNAGLLSPAEKSEIATALQPGDVTQYTDELAQDAVGTILLDTATIDLSYNDGTPSISADVKPNSIDATHLSNSINVSEFVNDSDYATETYVDSVQEELSYACSDEVSDLTVGTLITFRMPIGLMLDNVKLSLNVAPTVTKLIVDIKKNGVSIFSTLISVDTSTTTSVGASVPAVISDVNLLDDSIITISTTQIGSGVAGKGLKVTFLGKRI